MNSRRHELVLKNGETVEFYASQEFIRDIMKCIDARGENYDEGFFVDEECSMLVRWEDVSAIYRWY